MFKELKISIARYFGMKHAYEACMTVDKMAAFKVALKAN